MRISNSMNYGQAKSNISKNRNEMYELQNQAASMKRITKPSDDAVGTTRMLAIRTEKNNNDQFLKGLEMAKTFLNYSETALGQVTDLLVKAKELAISQSSEASSNATTRMATATEVEQMYNDLVNIGNRKFGDRFIFGGYKTMTNPFDSKGNYLGDDGEIKVEVTKGILTAINVPGDKIFHGRDNSLGTVPESRRGANTPNYPIPEKKEEIQIDARGPASIEALQDEEAKKEKVDPTLSSSGESVFGAMRSLLTGLKANDTVAIQETLERLDTAIDQVVMYRAEVGSRIQSLDNTFEALGKGKVDNAALLSSIEDADPFNVFTDITKNENVLKATLETSGKLMTPSLLDFLK